jgi:hypothetical protein
MRGDSLGRRLQISLWVTRASFSDWVRPSAGYWTRKGSVHRVRVRIAAVVPCRL